MSPKTNVNQKQISTKNKCQPKTNVKKNKCPDMRKDKKCPQAKFWEDRTSTKKHEFGPFENLSKSHLTLVFTVEVAFISHTWRLKPQTVAKQ